MLGPVNSRFTPIHNTSTEKQAVVLDLPPSTLERYVEASEEVEQTLGLSPGPEFLMSLAVEHEDPFEISDNFLGEIILALRESNPESAVAH